MVKPRRPSSPGGGSPGDPSQPNSLSWNPRGVRPAIHPGQTTGDETQAAQFSRWGLGRRSIPADRVASRRAAHGCVSVEIHPGQFSRWGLLPHAPCQPSPHREDWPASALTWVPPPAVHRAAHRCVSVETHPGQFSRWGLLPHAPCQPGPHREDWPHRENWALPASALTRVPPPAASSVPLQNLSGSMEIAARNLRWFRHP